MSCLILPRSSIAIPRGFAEIDWSNPITQDLEGWALPTYSPNQVETKYGKAASLGTGLLSVEASDRMRYGTVCAGLVRLPGAPTVDNQTYFSFNSSPATWYSDVEYLMATAYQTSGSRKFYFLHDRGSQQANGSLPPIDSYTHVAFRFDTTISGAWSNFYYSGVHNASLTPNGPFPWNTGVRRQLGAGNVSLGIYATYAYAFSRQLLLDELRSISQNPWQIFKGK